MYRTWSSLQAGCTGPNPHSRQSVQDRGRDSRSRRMAVHPRFAFFIPFWPALRSAAGVGCNKDLYPPAVWGARGGASGQRRGVSSNSHFCPWVYRFRWTPHVSVWLTASLQCLKPTESGTYVMKFIHTVSNRQNTLRI